MREPYSDDSSTRGVSAIQEEELEGMIRLAHQHDWPVAVHAIGDKTIQTVMDCIARVQSEQPKPIRHGIVHCQITDSSLLKRFAREDIATYIQPIFLEYDLHIAEKRVGARAKNQLCMENIGWRARVCMRRLGLPGGAFGCIGKYALCRYETGFLSAAGRGVAS